jgi:hypothetical protein
MLLAIRFHRAARLNAPELGERAAWRQYFAEHFPRGDEHALRLWEYWRNTQVKDEVPGKEVVVSHGQPGAHWQLVVVSDGDTVQTEPRLFINLESMCDDFEKSVDSFIGLLGRDPVRCASTLENWRKRQWSVVEVQEVMIQPPKAGYFTTASATARSINPTP